MRLVLYQTLEDRGNLDEIEQWGPFICTREDAWLTAGYYYWDAYIELAHWWGELAHHGNYIICQSNAILDDTCWDLHGNGLHRQEFVSLCNEIIESKLSTKGKLLVSHVIEFLRMKGRFKYSSVRALGVNSFSRHARDRNIILQISFKKNDATRYLELKIDDVQICLFNKRALSLHDYFIVHPEDYIDAQFA